MQYFKERERKIQMAQDLGAVNNAKDTHPVVPNSYALSMIPTEFI